MKMDLVVSSLRTESRRDALSNTTVECKRLFGLAADGVACRATFEFDGGLDAETTELFRCAGSLKLTLEKALSTKVRVGDWVRLKNGVLEGRVTYAEGSKVSFTTVDGGACSAKFDEVERLSSRALQPGDRVRVKDMERSEGRVGAVDANVVDVLLDRSTPGAFKTTQTVPRGDVILLEAVRPPLRAGDKVRVRSGPWKGSGFTVDTAEVGGVVSVTPAPRGLWFRVEELEPLP